MYIKNRFIKIKSYNKNPKQIIKNLNKVIYNIIIILIFK